MKKNPYLKIIILATIFGLGAGLVGQLFAAAYLLPGEIFVSSDTSRIKKTETPSEEAQNIADAQRAISPTVLEIYPQKTSAREPANQIYVKKDRIALGFALTSDGWLVSFGRTLADPKNHFVVVTADGKALSPQKIILDEATDVVFIKVDADNLAVPPLGDTENLKLADKLVISESKQALKISQIENLAYEKNDEPKDLFKSSEKITKTIVASGSWTTSESGAPVVNLVGEVVGLTSNSSNVVSPINAWRPAFLSILKNGKIQRPYFGVRYLDLSAAPGLGENFSQNRKVGALIWSDKNLQITGIAKNSPAAKSGLADGDIILKINTDEISSRNDLTEIIQEYSSGDKIKLTILRAGEEKIIEATLE